MARFMEIKSLNPKTKQDQITKELGCSSSTLQRYKNDINMLTPFRIPAKFTNKRKQEFSNANLDNNSQCQKTPTDL